MRKRRRGNTPHLPVKSGRARLLCGASRAAISGPDIRTGSGPAEGREGARSPRPSRPQPVHRAPDSQPATVQDMGVDHGGADIPVPQEFLDGPDVISVLQQVGGKAVPEAVAGGMTGNTGGDGGSPDAALNDALVGMPPAALAGDGVAGDPAAGEDVLPAPLPAGVRVLALEGIGEAGTTPAPSDRSRRCRTRTRARWSMRSRSRASGSMVIRSRLPLPARTRTWWPPKSRSRTRSRATSVTRMPHPYMNMAMSRVGPCMRPRRSDDLFAGQDDRKAPGTPGPDHALEWADLRPEDITIEKEQSGKCLVLCAGGDVAALGEVTDEGGHVFGAQVARVPPPVKTGVSPYPADVGSLGAAAVMGDA